MYTHNKISAYISLAWLGICHNINKIRIFGYSVVLSYMIAILYVWASAEYSGYVYFLAGEPNRAILYTEWILGLLAVIVIAHELRKNLIEAKPKVIYDPLV